MKLTKQDRVDALWAALFLLELELDAAQEQIEQLIAARYSYSSAEVVKSARAHGDYCVKYMTLRTQYRQLLGYHFAA